ncbi:MAG: roadblock/LC7 domain-containing protein [Gemmatimonadaceae bacterium]
MRPTTEALTQVTKLRGVRAALFTTMQDALPIDAVAHVDIDVEALAAFATSLMRRARQTSEMSRLGGVQFVSLDAAHGRVFTARRDDILAVALAGRDAHSGLVRVTLQRCLAGIA